MTHAQQLRDIAADLYQECFDKEADSLIKIATELEALKAREPMTDEQIDARRCASGLYRPRFAEVRLGVRIAEAHHNIKADQTKDTK